MEYNNIIYIIPYSQKETTKLIIENNISTNTTEAYHLTLLRDILNGNRKLLVNRL